MKQFVAQYNTGTNQSEWRFGINLPEGTVLPEYDIEKAKSELIQEGLNKKGGNKKRKPNEVPEKPK